MRAHWRHLANTIELVHPLTNSSSQPKRQMDRFNRFCTAYGRKCLYFTMGAPIHQNCPFPSGIAICHVIHDALGTCEPTTRMAPRSVSAVFAQMTAESPYTGLPVSPSKFFPPMLASGPHVIHGSLGPPPSGTQMATWSFQPFLQGSLVWHTDRATDRPTNHASRCEAA